MAKAKYELTFETLTTLERALELLSIAHRAVGRAARQVEDFDDKLATAEKALETANKEARGHKHRADKSEAMVEAAEQAARDALDQIKDMTADLERARQWVAVGRTGEALPVLDRLLGEIDPKCTRVTIVAPMLPFAGSFGA